jgi:hypothetical protein
MDSREDNHELDLLLPSSVTGPLWKSLLRNLRDRFFPEKLPPLQLTSRPVNTGMLIGDAVSLPWFKTVFTNLGNVINPEVLPPLELESRPMDVGELVSDQMGHMWWTSLLRNLADRVAPERLPALQLSSAPVDADLKSGSMQLSRWSSLITLPKVPLSERPYFAATPAAARTGAPRVGPVAPFAGFAGTAVLFDKTPAHATPGKLKTAISRSRVREALLISLAVLEALYLVGSLFGLV